MTNKKCGYVALMGRPNAGKSTLLNSILGQKLAVVSAKPQTTRNRILGVLTEGDTQALFLDTPGIHKAEGLPRINRTMNSAAWAVLADADVVCYLVDVGAGWHEEDGFYLQKILTKSDKKILLIASKVDSVKKEFVAKGIKAIETGWSELLARLGTESGDYTSRLISKSPLELSAKRPESVVSFKEALLQRLPEGPWLFAEDDLTDLPQQFLCGEIVREQIFRQLGQELPYHCAVKVDVFEHQELLTVINATIIVQRSSHKGIVIGRGGARLKSIGIAARESLERHLERKVYLELFVKVHEGWIDDKSLLAEYAHLKDLDL